MGGAERRSGGRRRRPQPEHGDTLASCWGWGPPGECKLRPERGERQVLAGAEGADRGGPRPPGAGAAQAEGQCGGRQAATPAAPPQGRTPGPQPVGRPKTFARPAGDRSRAPHGRRSSSAGCSARVEAGEPPPGAAGAEGNFTGRVADATTGASERGARTSSADGPWRRQPPGAGRPSGRQREGETERPRSLATAPEAARREEPPARSGRAGGRASRAAAERSVSGRRRPLPTRPGGRRARSCRTPPWGTKDRARRHASFLLGVGTAWGVRVSPGALGSPDPRQGERGPWRPAGRPRQGATS